MTPRELAAELEALEALPPVERFTRAAELIREAQASMTVVRQDAAWEATAPGRAGRVPAVEFARQAGLRGRGAVDVLLRERRERLAGNG